jgi:hypothetical protein
MAWESKSGARSSVQMPAYHLIYAGFLRLVADRLGYGAQKHGNADNFKLGAGDPEYIRDRENHLFAHVLKYMNATTLEERRKQMSAIGANCSMLTWLDDHSPAAATANGELLAHRDTHTV